MRQLPLIAAATALLTLLTLRAPVAPSAQEPPPAAGRSCPPRPAAGRRHGGVGRGAGDIRLHGGPLPGRPAPLVMGPLCKAKAGDRVDVQEGNYYEYFFSQALNREFQRIVVASRMSLNGQGFRSFSAHELPPAARSPAREAGSLTRT